MRKWKISESNREFMVDEIFKAGYAGPSEEDMIRWTYQQMLDLCDDEGLISLFERYVTWYPAKPGRDKEIFLAEVEAEIALDDMLA